MSKVTAKNAVVLVGGYNLSTYFTTYEAQEGAPPQEVTGFTDGAQNFIPGQFTATLTGNVLYDSASNKSFPVLKSYAGATSDVHVTILTEGGTAGYPSLSLPAMDGGLTGSGTPGGAVSIGTLTFSSMGDNEGIENGVCLHHGAVTVSTTDAEIADGDVTGDITARCSGTLHIWQACTSDTYEVKIQDCDTSDGVYSDLITFTMDGSAVGSERVAVASGTLSEFRRVVATRTGVAGDSFGFSVHFFRDPLATT